MTYRWVRALHAIGRPLPGNLSVGKKVDFQLIKQGNEYVIVGAK